MTKNARLLLILACTAACSRDKSPSAQTASDRSGADSTVYTSGAAASVPGTLPSGTVVVASIQQSLSSDQNAVGDKVRAVVTQNVVAKDGRVVIPGGSSVVFTIAPLGPASAGGAAGSSVRTSAFHDG